MEFWFTPKRWITGVRSQAASLIEALGLSCVSVLYTSFLEALLPVIAARDLAEVRHEGVSGRLASVQITVDGVGLC